MLAWWIVALFLAELAISARDVVVEGNIRVLPVPERILHLLLFVNLGVVMTLTGLSLREWWDLPTALARVDYGWASCAQRHGAAGAGMGRARWGERGAANS